MVKMKWMGRLEKYKGVAGLGKWVIICDKWVKERKSQGLVVGL